MLTSFLRMKAPGTKRNKSRKPVEKNAAQEKSAEIRSLKTSNGDEKLSAAGRIEAAKEAALLKKLEEGEDY